MSDVFEDINAAFEGVAADVPEDMKKVFPSAPSGWHWNIEGIDYRMHGGFNVHVRLPWTNIRPAESKTEPTVTYWVKAQEHAPELVRVCALLSQISDQHRAPVLRWMRPWAIMTTPMSFFPPGVENPPKNHISSNHFDGHNYISLPEHARTWLASVWPDRERILAAHFERMQAEQDAIREKALKHFKPVELLGLDGSEPPTYLSLSEPVEGPDSNSLRLRTSDTP